MKLSTTLRFVNAAFLFVRVIIITYPFFLAPLYCTFISVMGNPFPGAFYTCATCFKKCKSAGGLTRHQNSEHRDFTPESVDDAHENASRIDSHPLLTGKLMVVHWNLPLMKQLCLVTLRGDTFRSIHHQCYLRTSILLTHGHRLQLALSLTSHSTTLLKPKIQPPK